MRRFFPFIVLLIVLPLFSQQNPQSNSTTQNSTQAQNYGVPPAPKPGHPLDPNDVATLTGKNNAYQHVPYGTPQMYYTAPADGSMFSQSSVGNAFQGQPNGYMWSGTNWQGNAGWGWGPYAGSYSGFNGSQFANVTTETRAPFFTLRPGSVPFPLFGGGRFGHGRPGQFGNRWRRNLWFGPGSQFQHPTGSGSWPGLQP